MYFKSTENTLHFLSNEDIANGGIALLPAGCVETTEAEAAILQAPPPPTDAQIIEGIKAAVQAHMDQAAQAAGYDDIKSAVTYADEPAVPKFQAEGQAFRAWRSLVWAYAYDQLAKVQAGAEDRPTVAQFIAGIPALTLPTA